MVQKVYAAELLHTHRVKRALVYVTIVHTEPQGNTKPTETPRPSRSHKSETLCEEVEDTGQGDFLLVRLFVGLDH